ncbi:MAG: TerB family tellurite resistance protein [Ignavibacteriales bacterium]|nr:TerB family tellurite resistance protein [Ignavibacteriales bacterium]
MINFLKIIVSGLSPAGNGLDLSEKSTTGYPEEKKLQIATCALFIEVANSDSNIDGEEKKKIVTLMEELFQLSKMEVEELFILSEKKIKESISLYEFTDLINKNYNQEQKYNILKNLWRIIFLDNYLHKYEEYVIRKISSNLNIAHSDFIAAKLAVKEELGLRDN